MSRESFYRDLSRAWGFLHSPTGVWTDSPALYSNLLTRQVSRLDLWLSPRNMQEYHPDEFADQPQEVQKRLQSAVENFLALANQVSPTSPATPEQYREGRQQFESVASIVKEIVLPEWTKSVETVVGEVEIWCAKRDWPTRRYEAVLSERLLGDYTLTKLLFQAHGVRIELKPVARFVPGSLGMIELSVLPSYESVKLTKAADGWRLRIEAGNSFDMVKVLVWDERGFEEAVVWLSSHG